MSSQPLRPGDPVHLGGYRLHSRLGAGGMGTVFLGRSPQGKLVAVKVVRTEFIRDEGFLGRFRSEVNRARQVPPFCTAEVIDADLDHDPPYLVVEYVDGPTLTDVIRERGPLSPAALQSAVVAFAGTGRTPFAGSGTTSDSLAAGPAKSVTPPRPSSRQPTRKPAAPASPSAPKTSPEAEPNTSGRNLALNGEVAASSLEGEHWPASNAVDGDPETRWSSAFSDPQWLRVDLGAR